MSTMGLGRRGLAYISTHAIRLVWMANLAIVVLILLTGLYGVSQPDSRTETAIFVGWAIVPLLVGVMIWRGPRFLRNVSLVDLNVALWMLVPIANLRDLTAAGIAMVLAIEVLAWGSVAYGAINSLRNRSETSPT
jgi:hypothetical protein